MIEQQRKAPLFEELARHAAKKPAVLHVPGHRQGRGLPEELVVLSGKALFELDLTEIPGLDDLHNPTGPIAAAQELAAKLYGAGRSFFLVNGTTAGMQAFFLAVAGRRKVIVPRNAHRSVLSGLILSGADPVYVMPEIIPGFGIDCGVPARKVCRLLAENNDAAAVLVVRPNYYGVAGDLREMVRVVHDREKPVLIDEAHGAHLRFAPGLPEDAMAAGADAAVQSTHKLGGSVTQSSMLHLQGNRVDAGSIAAALNLLQTTSPSYLLMASLDLARRQLALSGKELLGRARELARWLRIKLSRIRGLQVLTAEHLPESCRLDPCRVVVSVGELGLTGYQVNQWLTERYNVYVEMADAVNVVAVVSTGTVRADCEALAGALEDIAARCGQHCGRVLLPCVPAGGIKRMKPGDAWFAPAAKVSLPEAEGRICAETVAVYPPGIPVINPGEEITPEISEYLSLVKRMGLHCQGASDPGLKTVKVVVE